MAYSKTTDLNSLFSNIYEGSRYVMRENGLMPQLVTRLSGDTYASRIFSRTTQTVGSAYNEAAALSEALLAKTAIGTATPITVRHGFLLSDQLKMTDPDGAATRASQEAGLAIANKIDQDLVGLFDDITASRGSGGAALTLAQVAQAMADLTQNAIGLGRRYAVVGVYTWYDIYAQLTNVTTNPTTYSANDLVNEAMKNYYMQSYAGAMWFQTPAIGTTGTAGTASGALFNEQAFVYDVRKPLMMEVERNVTYLGDLLAWSIMYAAAVQDSTYAIQLKSRNSTP